MAQRHHSPFALTLDHRGAHLAKIAASWTGFTALLEDLAAIADYYGRLAQLICCAPILDVNRNVSPISRHLCANNFER